MSFTFLNQYYIKLCTETFVILYYCKTFFCYIDNLKISLILLFVIFFRSRLKNVHITDISWYRDILYLVTNASTVMWYNITSHEEGFMPDMDNVGSLAVDWVGKKIYWSNPKQQLVSVINCFLKCRILY